MSASLLRPVNRAVHHQTVRQDVVERVIHARRTVLPRYLDAPGPDAAQLNTVLAAAAAAPDHGCLLPWRFVLLSPAARQGLKQVFLSSLLERTPGASAALIAQAQDRAFRSPVLLLAIVRLGNAQSPIGDDERIVSAGCAIQNMLLMATALGFASSLTTGSALGSRPLAALAGLAADEKALCFINIGTSCSEKPVRVRPLPAHYFSAL